MRTEIRTYNIYSFDELSKEVQAKVIERYKSDEWIIENRDNDFYYYCLKYFQKLFPNSDIELQYSLSYCQGDGLEVYGSFNFLDLLHWNISDFSEKEVKTLTYYFTNIVRDNCKLDGNRHYCYYSHKVEDFYYPIVDDLEVANTRDINYEVIEKFSKITNRTLERVCYSWADIGYDMIYNITDEEIINEINANEYEFLADGTEW